MVKWAPRDAASEELLERQLGRRPSDAELAVHLGGVIGVRPVERLRAGTRTVLLTPDKDGEGGELDRLVSTTDVYDEGDWLVDSLGASEALLTDAEYDALDRVFRLCYGPHETPALEDALTKTRQDGPHRRGCGAHEG
jgi:hypothetical protein